MKKSYKLQDLDCANCAAKMENALNKITGMKQATVSFMMQKMIIEAADEQFEAVLAEALKVIKKIDPDVIVKA